MKLIKTKVDNLEDGDIFYVNKFELDNSHVNGVHSDMSGVDDIFIVDDQVHEHNEIIIFINGGHELYFNYGDIVYKIGHYGDLISKVKEIE